MNVSYSNFTLYFWWWRS